MILVMFIILTLTVLCAIILKILNKAKGNAEEILYQKTGGASSMFSTLIKDVQSNPTSNNAIEVAKKLRDMIKDYDRTKPVPIVDIVKQMGFVIKIADTLPNDDSGIIIIDPELNDIIGNSKCVLINQKIKYGKRRFILAHEIGHYLFEFDNTNEPRFVHSFVRSYNKASASEPIEQKVNEFAAELLMPAEIFELEYKKLKESNILNSTDIIVTLSNFFETTTKSVEMRIVELGL